MNETTTVFRVFLIADDPKVLSVVINDLKSYSNLDVVQFDSVEVALQNLRDNLPLYILVEGRIGGKTVLQLLEATKANTEHRNIPVIIYARALSNELKSGALRIGVHAVFHNPQDYKKLNVSLSKLIMRTKDKGVKKLRIQVFDHG